MSESFSKGKSTVSILKALKIKTKQKQTNRHHLAKYPEGNSITLKLTTQQLYKISRST